MAPDHYFRRLEYALIIFAAIASPSAFPVQSSDGHVWIVPLERLSFSVISP
jgi:hypothetical protein